MMEKQGLDEVSGRDTPRATQVDTSPSKGNGSRPVDPEVEPKAKRRRFSAAYKLRILEEVDSNPGQAGAIIRREGLYSSHLTTWRKQRRDGLLLALGGKKRGRKEKSAAARELLRLTKENVRLERELEKAQVIIGAQKKLAEILGVDLPKIVDSGDDE